MGADGSPRVDVLGTWVSAVGPGQAVDEIGRWVATPGLRSYVCVTGVHGVMESVRDPWLRGVHNCSGLTVPEGAPLVRAGRRAGVSGTARVYGPDLMLSVLERAAEQGWASYFYGGAEGVPELLGERMAGRFPGLKVVGAWSPPARPATAREDEATVRRINDSGADLVWVGLPTPRQERWMAAHRERLRASVLVGVGETFDLHTGRVPQAPERVSPQPPERMPQVPERVRVRVRGRVWVRMRGLVRAYGAYRSYQSCGLYGACGAYRAYGGGTWRLWRRRLRDGPSYFVRIAMRPPRLVTAAHPVRTACAHPAVAFAETVEAVKAVVKAAEAVEAREVGR